VCKMALTGDDISALSTKVTHGTHISLTNHFVNSFPDKYVDDPRIKVTAWCAGCLAHPDIRSELSTCIYVP
jgi:hypothetical protein